MNLHEYQAKKLFADYGIPVPEGKTAKTADEASQAARDLGGDGWVVKAQVHAGGRGKAGGVKLVKNQDALMMDTRAMLGSRLVTEQTDKLGLPIATVLVEELTDIDREFYLSLVVDRSQERITLMASAAGGMDIEQVAAETPEKILNLTVDPAAGLQPYQCRKIAFLFGLQGKQISKLSGILQQLLQLFIEKDASQIEINPLVATASGDLKALDGKINFDDNALFAHPDIVELRDQSQEDEIEAAAHQHGLSYVNLDGSIGCMVNGAGLAMATMDLVRLCGGQPANFLDVGGDATADRVTEAFRLILSEPRVKAVLVNIFGGIVRCDMIAEGIIEAFTRAGVDRPVIVRLEGTNAERGREMLRESNLEIIAVEDLEKAAKQAVEAAGETVRGTI